MKEETFYYPKLDPVVTKYDLNFEHICGLNYCVYKYFYYRGFEFILN